MFTNSLFFLNFYYLVSYSLVYHWHSSNFLSSSHIFFSLIITINSSWLLSISINAWDTNVPMLSSLLLANIRIWSCFFFFFLVMLSNFLLVPFVTEKIKVKLALAIPTGAPSTLLKEMIDTPPDVALKTIKIFSM